MQAFRRYDEKSTGCLQFGRAGEWVQVLLASHSSFVFFLGLVEGRLVAIPLSTKALYFGLIIAPGRK